MNKYHQEILDLIIKKTKQDHPELRGSNYSGSSHPRYNLSVPETRILAKSWVTKNKEIKLEEFRELLNVLFQSNSTDEKKIAGELLAYLPKQRLLINPNNLNKWLEHLEGWEEIDSLCQSIFTDKDMLNNWPEWEKLIKGFAGDQNIVKRRASLVLLTWPVEHSEDKRFADLALINIEKLKTENNILITKAISWLLRSMIKFHRNRVEEYFKNNQTSLPKIAVRETLNKLLKGKK